MPLKSDFHSEWLSHSETCWQSDDVRVSLCVWPVYVALLELWHVTLLKTDMMLTWWCSGNGKLKAEIKMSGGKKERLSPANLSFCAFYKHVCQCLWVISANDLTFTMPYRFWLLITRFSSHHIAYRKLTLSPWEDHRCSCFAHTPYTHTHTHTHSFTSTGLTSLGHTSTNLIATYAMCCRCLRLCVCVRVCVCLCVCVCVCTAAATEK